MMSGMRTLRIPALVACSLLSFACSMVKSGSGDSPDAGPIPAGVGVGEACQNTNCRSGLSCDTASKTCIPGGSVIQGGACIVSGECVVGNYCNQQGACAPSGKAAAGAGCSSEGD